MNYHKYIDHTLLKPNAINDDYIKLFSEANEFNFYSVCIPASFLELAKKHVSSSVKLCTVIGFPLGYGNAKKEEAQIAIELGAHEVDMVINISKLKNQDFEFVKNEIQSVASINEDVLVKVIIETDYLSEEEKIKMCHIINETNAGYIKTSTGFAQSGAQIADIELFKKYLSPDKKIKASGGIRDSHRFLEFINAGAQRIGLSAGVKVMNELISSNT